MKRPMWTETEGNLWDIRDFVKEAVIETIPKKKGRQKGKVVV